MLLADVQEVTWPEDPNTTLARSDNRCWNRARAHELKQRLPSIVPKPNFHADGV